MAPTKGKRRSDSSTSSSDSESSDSSQEYKKEKLSSGEESENSNSKSKPKSSKKTKKRESRRSSDEYDDKHEKKRKRSRSSDGNRTGNQSRNSKNDLNSEHYDNERKLKYKDDNKYNRSDDRWHRNEDDEKYRRGDDKNDDRRRNDRYNDRSYKRDNRNRDRADYGGDNRRSPGRDRRDNRNGRRFRSRSRSFDHSNAKWGKDDNSKSNSQGKPTDKQKPNFGLSGKLTEETNTYRGVVIKYSEPPEARKPRRRWRLYPFKGEKALQTLYIHRESAYLIGRDRKVVDLPVDHPSCSKQHAALQYRLVPFTRDDGSAGKRVRPYLIDLESANGTFINNKKIDSKKYIELLEKDVIKFGFSSREYVLLHENSKDEAQDDDVKLEEEEASVKKENTD